MINDWKEVYRYREFLKNSVSKDLRTRYRGSVFGFLWTFLNPLMMLAVYSVLFSIVVRMPVEHYPIFLFSTLLAWSFFQSSVQTSSSVIVNSNNLIKKIYFPHEILPLSVVIGGLMNFLFGQVVLIPALAIFGYYPNVHYIWLPVILAVEVIMVSAIAFLVSSLTVFFRDLEHMLNIILSALFYLTPVLFPISMVPERFRWVYNWNPIGFLMISFRDVYYYNRMPDIGGLFLLGLISLILLIVTHGIFRRLKGRFVEEI